MTIAANHPRHLFKYQAIRPGSVGHLESILVGNKLWLSPPTAFNDPFDCLPILDTFATRREQANFVHRVISRQSPGLSRNQRRLRARPIKVRATLTPSMLATNGAIIFKRLMEQIGICCLTTEPDNFLMWSHYTGSHEGVCLRFRHMELPFAAAHRVVYSAHRPVVRPLVETERRVADTFLTKADWWAYENEWRIIQVDVLGHLEFPAAALDGVILGARISAANEQLVRDMLLKRTSPIRLMRARIDDHDYRLNIGPA